MCFPCWAVAEIMAVVALNQTVLSLSAPLCTRGLFIQGMCVHASVWCAHACVYMWSDSAVCVFPLQVVLSICLCFWFCLLSMQGWFGDAQGRWKVVKSAPVCCGFYFTLFHVVVFLFQFLFLFHLSISLSRLALVTFFTVVYSILFHLAQFLSIYLASVIPSPQAFPVLAHRSSEPH